MKLPLDVRCLECGKIFCCADCRRVHEAKQHGISYDCRLCRFDPLFINSDNPPTEQLMAHVCCSHMPLGCKKCGKVFCNEKELSENGLCNGRTEMRDAYDEMPPPTREFQSPPEAAVKQGPIFTYLKLKVNGQSEVMTSTPTHPSTAKWGMFQKSFTSSTISGINSPDSDAAASPPTDGQKTSQLLSSIESPPNANEMAPPKGIISKISKIGSGDQEGVSNAGIDPEVTRDDPSNFNKTPLNNSQKRKTVTFAQDVLLPKKKTHFHFLKPKRTCTPGKKRTLPARTPRFQAMINNFESRATKLYTTPKQTRFHNPEDTPPTTADPNANGITGRTINFIPNDSPTAEGKNSPPVTFEEKKITESDKRSQPLSVASPIETEISDIDHYKTCVVESPDQPLVPSPVSRGRDDLSEAIAKSIQETLSSVFHSAEGSTEIQLSIKITKRTVAVKESRIEDIRSSDGNGNGQQKCQVEAESTTIWSRLVSGLKWVVWGDKNIWNGSPQGISESRGFSLESGGSTEAMLMSASKRKRQQSIFSGSPVSKRYRYSGRIHGRRPLDRMLRGGVVLPERCQSSDFMALNNFKEKSANDFSQLNRSF